MRVALRRGLPRTPGGEPWPPAGFVEVPDAAVPAPAILAGTAASTAGETGAALADPVPAADAAALTTVALRRGLPRRAGGPAWPETDTAQVPPDPTITADVEPVAAPPAAPEPEPVPQPAEAPLAPAEPVAKPEPAAEPIVPVGKPARGVDKQKLWWLVAVAALGVVAVLVARWVVGTPWGADFVARYPGEQPLPEDAPVGLPAWLGWSHFFNMFLMVLVIRTGLQVRTERKPQAYWAPRWAPKRKVSLTLWLHQALDVLWVLNGAVFYVLLFATGHWVRIVPTSWEVFPNAVSAGLQYLTLDWPLENGWVHYNALQELAYFTTVFIAAPLAIVSGLRLSSFWSEKWTGASGVFSLQAARRIHFPVMVYFLVFIAVHVVLLALTGFRRNMAAMFAARGDVDPTVYATDWTGVWVFIGALAVIALGWFVARPSLLAPLANATGKVSNR